LVTHLRQQRYNRAPAGTIIGQDPQPGAPMPKGGIVEVDVSLGLPLVPDLRGMTPAKAANMPGLVVRIKEERGDPAPVGTIIEQDPKAGASMPANGVIYVVIAKQSSVAWWLPLGVTLGAVGPLVFFFAKIARRKRAPEVHGGAVRVVCRRDVDSKRCYQPK